MVGVCFFSVACGIAVLKAEEDSHEGSIKTVTGAHGAAHARSLQRAGICVLIGGFTAFLPYKEYSIRNKAICAKEAELQSFEVLSIKRSNFNCVLSKDRVTYKYDRD